jgi:hypothetical protein
MAAIHRDDDRDRYEIEEGGGPAGFAQFVNRPGRVILVHTEIDPQFAGHGLGGKLAAGALDDIRSRGLRVVPLCPFIARYIEEHPEYDDLVDHEALAALEKP